MDKQSFIKDFVAGNPNTTAVELEAIEKLWDDLEAIAIKLRLEEELRKEHERYVQWGKEMSLVWNRGPHRRDVPHVWPGSEDWRGLWPMQVENDVPYDVDYW